MTGSPYDRGDYENAGVASRHLGDTRKRFTNFMRLATVCDIDPPKGVAKCQIAFCELITDWLPWMTLRGRTDRHWWSPEIDDTVILFSPSGDMASAFIWPGTFSNENWNGDREDLDRITYADKTTVQYQRNDKGQDPGTGGPGEYVMYVTGGNGDGHLWIKTDGMVVIEARDGIFMNEAHIKKMNVGTADIGTLNANTIYAGQTFTNVVPGGGAAVPPDEPLPMPSTTEGVLENKPVIRCYEGEG
jgi:phage baseplate assembly protein V